jgi:hypothetical protein
MAYCHGLNDDLSSDSFPLMYSLIDREQQKDEILLAQAQKLSITLSRSFMGVAILFMN